MGLSDLYERQEAKWANHYRQELQHQDKNQLIRQSNADVRTLSAFIGSTYVGIFFAVPTCGISLIPATITAIPAFLVNQRRHASKDLLAQKGHEYHRRPQDIALGGTIGTGVALVTQGIGNLCVDAVVSNIGSESGAAVPAPVPEERSEWALKATLDGTVEGHKVIGHTGIQHGLEEGFASIVVPPEADEVVTAAKGELTGIPVSLALEKGLLALARKESEK